MLNTICNLIYYIYNLMMEQAIVKEATKLLPNEPIGLKAVLKAVETKTAKIQDIVDMATQPKEFNLKIKPVPEMARISTFIHEGVSCQEMLALAKAGELPSLIKPEMQWPMVEIIEKLGQAVIVSQVIVEESALGLKPKEAPEVVRPEESTTETLSTATENTTTIKTGKMFHMIFYTFKCTITTK